VLSVECRYKRPLVFDEPFAVYAKIVKFNGATLHMEYRIISRKSGELCAEGTSSHCFTDMDMKPVRTKHSYPEVYQIFADYLGYEITD